MDLRYPIGTFTYEGPDSGKRKDLIVKVSELPEKLKAAVNGLNDEQLDTPYRPEGWTVRQVVHHLADSQMNGYTRFKLGLTENKPAIKTFEEMEWAAQEDYKAPIDESVDLFTSLHRRWALLMESLPAESWEKVYVHPESGELTLDQALHLYLWHASHHIAHITTLRKRMNW